MIIPKALNFNDTIGICAPAGFYEHDEIIDCCNKIKSLNFNIKLGKNIFNQNRYLAGTDKERAEDIMDLIKDPSVKAIVSFRGGYGCIRILEYLDYEVIKNNPKYICGYSDLTVLINHISDLTGLVTLHGPMVNSDFSDDVTINSFVNMLTMPLSSMSIDLSCNKAVYNKKNIAGTLGGGNIVTICSSLGTPYEMDFNNKILLLEEVNEDYYVLDRLLTQLKLSGKLDKCAGFLIGYICDLGKQLNENKILEIIEDILVPLGLPIIYGLDFGHKEPNITLPIGCKVSIDFDKMVLSPLL